LDKLPVTVPSEAEYAKHVYHLYVVRVQNRAELSDWLSESGVATGIHYPIPIHLQEAYADLGHKAGDFPVVEEQVKEIVSLPMFPHISEGQVEYVVDTIKEFLSKQGEDTRGCDCPTAGIPSQKRVSDVKS
jgi:dTDP-4-amino-4,6-dideoxygalactose transaminase